MNKTPLSVEDALEFLAGYHKKNIGNPTPRLASFDQPVINNLASKALCGKPFSEKQGKLALIFVKKYRNQLRRGNVDIDTILRTKLFRKPTVAAIPSILCFEKEDNEIVISLSFHYDSRLIRLLHNRNQDAQSNHLHRFEWDGHDKKWTSKVFIDNFEFAYKLASENEFYIEPIVEEYAKKINEYRAFIKKPTVRFENGKLIFANLFNEQQKHILNKFDVKH